MNYRDLFIEFDLFSADECKNILPHSNNLEFTNYSIKLKNKFTENGSSMKSQDLVENETTQWIFDKLTKKLTDVINIKWSANPHGVFRNYTKGDFFLEHKDNVDKTGADPRYFTVTVQLSESTGYSGGEVIVDRKHTVSKKIGSATLWGSNVVHEVKNITEGTRNSLVFFVSSKHIKTEIKSLL